MSDAQPELPPLPSGLTRVTVNLTPRASQALDHATGLTGDSKTDTINRALQFYLMLVEEERKGGNVYVGTLQDQHKGVFTRIQVI